MTDQELIKELRCFDSFSDVPDAAANRIEELVKELQDTEDRANAFATKEYHTEMRAERAEAKLTKAVEALREIVSNQGYMDDPWGHATAVLAELEGGE